VIGVAGSMNPTGVRGGYDAVYDDAEGVSALRLQSLVCLRYISRPEKRKNDSNPGNDEGMKAENIK
jgi:hypothetical protein